MRKNKAKLPPEYLKAYSRLCIFCADRYPFEPEHVPLNVATYAHLIPEGVVKLCDGWKVCRKHREALEEQALNVQSLPETTPFD